MSTRQRGRTAHSRHGVARECVLLDWLQIDRSASVPVYRQISEQLREAVLHRRIVPGAYLPASRALAADLGISRITALQAYEHLIAEGFLEARSGSGTRVSPTLDGGCISDAALMRAFSSKPADHACGACQDLYDGEPSVCAFQPGIPAFDTFPRQIWSRLLQRHGGRNDQFVLDYAHPGGYAPLRHTIARYLTASRGVSCSAEQVIVVTSVRAAISLTCAMLTPSGSAAVVEDPGYNTGRRCLQAAGLQVLHVPVDEQGISVDHPSLGSPLARLAYITPAHQWPTGVTLSAARRLRLLDWASSRDSWIIEDDYDSEFRYSSPPVATLFSLARGERVIYVGTFSKTLVPSIRCAYLVVPEVRWNGFAEMAFKLGVEPSLHVQAALSDFMAQGHFARYIIRMRKIYRRRRDCLVDALRESLGAQVQVAPPEGGLQLVANLSPELVAAEVSHCAARANILARDIAIQYWNEPSPNALHLGFAAVPEEEIGPAVRQLKAAVEALC